MTWVLIRKNFRFIVLKYANFTNIDHLRSILINLSAFLEKNYYFTSKNAPKVVDPLILSSKSCTIFVVHHFCRGFEPWSKVKYRPKDAPEISRRIFWRNENLKKKRNFKHPIKPEVYRK